MQFTVHELSQPLSDCIESVFHFAHFQPDHSVERVVPTGHVFLIFELDDMTRHTYEIDGESINGSHQKAWLSGTHRTHITISAHPDSEMLVVQFKPHGAYPFIHESIDNFTEQVIPAEGVFGKAVIDLREQIKHADPVTEKFALINAWLQSRYQPELTVPSELSDMIMRLQNQPMTALKDVTAQYQHTQKHLIDQFKKYVGLTPKYYLRIIRFNELLQQIQQQQQIKWSDVAFQCGYSDQSHFIKEFKLFSGFNPTEFLDRSFQEGEANFFPLDQD